MLFGADKEKTKNVSLGVILDIGSGSVGVAIVASSPAEKFPSILWSYREYLPISKDDTDTRNRISTTLLNVFLELDGKGLKILRDKYPHHPPSIIQASLNAPFAYTISRNVLTESAKSMRVNSKLISALENKATEGAHEQVATALAKKTMNLATLSEVITSVKVDGYSVRLPYDGEGSRVSLHQLIGLTSTNLIEEIELIRDKVLPKAQIDFDSFMSLYSRALLDIVSFKNDVGLISVTAKATEMMAVSEGDPFISTFLTKGHHSLAGSISEVSGLDMSESLGIMRDNDIDHAKLLNKDKLEAIQSVISSYEDEMTSFIRSLGDALVIPKNIYLQIDKNYEKFFVDSFSRSISKATGLKHTVYPFTSKFFDFDTEADSRILCPAYIFHKKLYSDGLAEDRYLL
ncbi:MAG: hypothetical protein WDZ56_00450 [Candidatus Paceibacterota bacterium]